MSTVALVSKQSAFKTTYNEAVAWTANHTFRLVHRLNLTEKQGIISGLFKVAMAFLTTLVPLAFTVMALSKVWKWAVTKKPAVAAQVQQAVARVPAPPAQANQPVAAAAARVAAQPAAAPAAPANRPVAAAAARVAAQPAAAPAQPAAPPRVAAQPAAPRLAPAPGAAFPVNAYRQALGVPAPAAAPQRPVEVAVAVAVPRPQGGEPLVAVAGGPAIPGQPAIAAIADEQGGLQAGVAAVVAPRVVAAPVEAAAPAEPHVGIQQLGDDVINVLSDSDMSVEENGPATPTRHRELGTLKAGSIGTGWIEAAARNLGIVSPPTSPGGAGAGNGPRPQEQGLGGGAGAGSLEEPVPGLVYQHPERLPFVPDTIDTRLILVLNQKGPGSSGAGSVSENGGSEEKEPMRGPKKKKGTGSSGAGSASESDSSKPTGGGRSATGSDGKYKKRSLLGQETLAKNFEGHPQLSELLADARAAAEQSRQDAIEQVMRSAALEEDSPRGGTARPEEVLAYSAGAQGAGRANVVAVLGKVRAAKASTPPADDVSAALASQAGPRPPVDRPQPSVDAPTPERKGPPAAQSAVSPPARGNRRLGTGMGQKKPAESAASPAPAPAQPAKPRRKKDTGLKRRDL